MTLCIHNILKYDFYPEAEWISSVCLTERRVFLLSIRQVNRQTKNSPTNKAVFSVLLPLRKRESGWCLVPILRQENQERGSVGTSERWCTSALTLFRLSPPFKGATGFLIYFSPHKPENKIFVLIHSLVYILPLQLSIYFFKSSNGMGWCSVPAHPCPECMPFFRLGWLPGIHAFTSDGG